MSRNKILIKKQNSQYKIVKVLNNKMKIHKKNKQVSVIKIVKEIK